MLNILEINNILQQTSNICRKFWQEVAKNAHKSRVGRAPAQGVYVIYTEKYTDWENRVLTTSANTKPRHTMLTQVNTNYF